MIISNKICSRALLLTSVAFGLGFPIMALAQATPKAGSEDTTVVVVTGTSKARTALKTPLAVSVIDAKAIERLSSSSQAGILNTVPTIKAEGGGGEVAVNVFIKGLPSAGQYQFTPLEYDGIPTFSTFGLNSSAYDVYERGDLSVSRLEFVRGGVSNLFGPGSVAGIINYITVSGNDAPHTKVQVEAADHNRLRTDFLTTGPLGSNSGLYYAASGYYRYDEGPLVSGNPTEGYQFRGNLKKVFDDGSGSLTVFGQLIDDNVIFYGDSPVNGTTFLPVAGNDGKKVYTVQTNDVQGMSYMTPGGRFTTGIQNGVATKGGALSAVLRRDLGNSWSLDAKAKVSKYTHSFNYFLGGDGVVNAPETQNQYLADRHLTGTGVFTYTDTGKALASTDLLFADRFIDRERDATDTTGELNLTKKFDAFGISHAVTIGTFASRTEAMDFDVTTQFLAAFNNSPKIVNLSVTNGAQTTVISQNGLLGETGYTNNRASDNRVAFYAADQMETGPWVLDIGLREESFNGNVSQELTQKTVTPSTTLSTGLQTVTWGTGQFRRANLDTHAFAESLGVLYRVNNSLSFYANAANGYFFPQLNSVIFDSSGNTASYKPELIKTAETGFKYNKGGFFGSISANYTELDNRHLVVIVNNGLGDGGTVPLVNLVSSKSTGIEADGRYRFASNWSVDGNVTLQSAKYTAYQSPTVNYVGHQLARQPKFLYNAGVYYDDDTISVSLFTNYTGSNYSNDANSILFKGFSLVYFDTSYKFEMAHGSYSTISLHVDNLLNNQSMTEGSPFQGNSQIAGGTYFIGRPSLPRRISLRWSYDF